MAIAQVIIGLLIAVVSCSTNATKSVAGSNKTGTHHVFLRTIQEVAVGKGFAEATSEFSDAYSAEHGFTTNYAYGWRSKNNYGDNPEMIWYHFRGDFVPAEVTFRALNNVAETPTKYQIVGSESHFCDEFAAWDILCEDLSGTPTKSRYEMKRCVIDNHAVKRPYHCVGIRVLNTADRGAYVGLSNIRFWKFISPVQKMYTKHIH